MTVHLDPTADHPCSALPCPAHQSLSQSITNSVCPQLYGFTLNFAYTNLAAISERIRTSCIHYNHDASVEFCVAVHLHAHANDVLSVWLFLLSMVPLVE